MKLAQCTSKSPSRFSSNRPRVIRDKIPFQTTSLDAKNSLKKEASLGPQHFSEPLNSKSATLRFSRYAFCLFRLQNLFRWRNVRTNQVTVYPEALNISDSILYETLVAIKSTNAGCCAILDGTAYRELCRGGAVPAKKKARRHARLCK